MRECSLLFLLFYLSVNAAAQPGTIDSSFGSNGFVLTKIPGSTETHFEQSTIQKDGKIVAVGWAFIPRNNKANYDFIVVRYNSDGTPDGSFGSRGIVITDFNDNSDFATSVVIQDDGKIVVGGHTQALDGSGSNVALVRYNANGKLDHTFGNKGKIVTTLNQDSQVKRIFIQKDGKIIAVGFTQDFLLIRYNTDGTIDPDFGKSGIVLTDFDSGYDVATSAAIQGDDKIVVAGNLGTSIILARYNSNGSLDKRFGEQGKVITKLPKDFLQLSDIALQDNNTIIVGGTVYNLSTDQKNFAFFLARYTAKGTLDNSFGVNGLVFTDFGHNSDEAISAIALQNNEKILVGGGVSPYKNAKVAGFASARYHLNGSLDASFATRGIAGVASTNFNLSPDEKYYSYIYSINVSKNRMYCVGMNKLADDNGNLSSAQGIIAAYKLGNKNLSCTSNKTVASDKGICGAVVNDVNPVMIPSGNEVAIKYTLTGATTENGRGSVSGKTFNTGVTSVTYKLANDPLQSCSFLVTVEDREAPVITPVSASPSILSPNRKIQAVEIKYRLKDNCGARATLSIQSNAGSEDDWEVIDAHHVRLRAIRPGQIFTITILATDKAGNKSSKKVDVVASK